MALIVVSITAMALAVYLDNVVKSLPDIQSNPDKFIKQRTTLVYASDGSVLAEWHGEQNRTIVGLIDMPPHLRNAVVAIEDKRYYEHHGVDLPGIMRALRVNVEAGEIEQGGSTITQQVAKNLFSSGKRDLSRKVREALTANALEARADKGKLLEIYLNTVYFGRGYYGVESAAKHYFGQTTNSLSLAECATLAGIIQSPTRFCPLDHPEDALRRRNVVLDQMLLQGYITPDQHEKATKLPIGLAPQVVTAQRAPFFVEYIKQDLIDRLGAEAVYTGGLRVFTTLDPALQALAEKASKRLSARGDPEVAIAVVRHSDGQVLALVGGRDFNKSQFNLAVQGRRQPGSAFKPFVLATALGQGIRPTNRYLAAPYSVKVKDGVWNVQNYENKFAAGSMSLAAATNWSVNAVYARLIMQVGPKNVVDTAKRMGIETELDADPAIALGGLRLGVSPLEMASAYGTIASGGLAVSPSGIRMVLDDNGKPVYEPKRTAHRAIARTVAVEEARMLHDVVERGTGVKAKIGRWAAGKTGTTQSYRDAWFVGWSGDISTAVWVGNRDGQVPMTNVHGIKVTGGSFPAMIWGDFMRQASVVRGRPAARAASSSGAGGPILARLCETSRLLATSRCPQVIGVYLSPVLVPAKECSVH